ncbi:MAG: trypsin-like peptidase domain-containing protein, partial [Solirubrobacterales bacterium]|nr:trypsin-like peptidase domain-containing protein [Solirubrobacterales bacterium]
AVPGAAPADSRSRTVRAVYAAASPSVVSVRVRSGGSAASGTGFLIDSDGTIVTNAHVVSGAQEAQVRLDDGGRDVDADVIGTDASSDLAVIRVDRDDADGIRPLALADSERVQVGDLAVAIGYPLGLDRTATAGIVSGVGRQIEAPNGFSIDKVIQTDAPINPGNSGGPLLDSAGRVIGVNSQIATAGGGGSVGIGFAVPANTVREVVPRLRQGQSIRRAFLGVSTAEVPFGPGAAVAQVVPSGPGDAAGLREGDVIRRVGGRDVRAPEDVGAAVEALKPGERVDVEVERGGARDTLGVTLGTRPERTP